MNSAINFKRLDHVQICIPIGKEDEARIFYTDIMGLKEVPKPAALISNGGLWYEIADIRLHIGVETEVVKSKRHPAFEITDVAAARVYLEKHGVKINAEPDIPDIKRFSFIDPFNNRIELLQKV